MISPAEVNVQQCRKAARGPGDLAGISVDSIVALSWCSLGKVSRLHVGITPWQLGNALHADYVAQQAVQAEAWGYDSFFLPESHFTANTPIPDPLLLLAGIAARTREIRLGTSSYLLPIRHPLLAAEQVASLDQFSGGRLILGLGRGYRASMLAAFGVRNSEKRQRFEEALATMRDAWSGRPCGEDLCLSPMPLQRPHPPIWIAAFGPKALEQAGALGYPYLASPVESLSALEQNLCQYRAARTAAGHAQAETVPVMRTVFISRDAGRCQQLRDRLANSIERGAAIANPGPVDSWCLIGDECEVAEQLAQYREDIGMTHLIAVRPRVSGIDAQWIIESVEGLAKLKSGMS